MALFEKAIGPTLQHEKGYVDDPHDTGGATQYGISIRFLRHHLQYDKDDDRVITKRDIRQLTIEDAKCIYRDQFWNKYHYNFIDSQPIANKLFDMCVNMGSKRAHIITQRALNQLNPSLNLLEDGVLGQYTFKAIKKSNPLHLLSFIRLNQCQFYLDLVGRRPRNRKFLLGWMRRAFA